MYLPVAAGLRELHRVLGPDGRLILAVRMRCERAGVLDPSRCGYTDDQVEALQAALRAMGFRQLSIQWREIGRDTIEAISARRDTTDGVAQSPAQSET